MTWIVVGLGGALGSLARHGVNLGLSRWMGRPTHYGTLVVNVIGCALIGWLAGLLASERVSMSGTMRAFVFVGLLGGFTTFSSFALDTLTLASAGGRAAAAGNLLGQVGLGMLAVTAGFLLGRN